MESFPNRSHNFVIDLAHRGVSVAQWLEHRSAESEGLRFDSSWGLRNFSLLHARDKTKTFFRFLIVFHLCLQKSVVGSHGVLLCEMEMSLPLTLNICMEQPLRLSVMKGMSYEAVTL